MAKAVPHRPHKPEGLRVQEFESPIRYVVNEGGKVKPGSFRLTSFSLGRAVTEVTVTAETERELHEHAERLPAHGLPGSHPKAASKSRVVGVKRLT